MFQKLMSKEGIDKILTNTNWNAYWEFGQEKSSKAAAYRSVSVESIGGIV